MQTSDMTDRFERELNQLYWNTERTVEEILTEKSIGRATLYRHIRPLSADAECSRCGSDLAYPNRNSRSAGAAVCTGCGHEETVGRESDGAVRVGADGQSTGSNQPVRYAPRSAATLVRNRIGDPERAAAEIGFTAAIDLREGLERLIAWRAAHKAEVESRRGKAGAEA